MGIFNKKMKFMAAICPECKGNLELDANLETAFCQYCGAQCIVENGRKKQRKQTKLEIVLDFFERQQSLKRQDKAEKRRKEQEEQQERKRELRKNWWIYALLIVGLFTLCIIMTLLEK